MSVPWVPDGNGGGRSFRDHEGHGPRRHEDDDDLRVAGKEPYTGAGRKAQWDPIAPVSTSKGEGSSSTCLYELRENQATLLDRVSVNNRTCTACGMAYFTTESIVASMVATIFPFPFSIATTSPEHTAPWSQDQCDRGASRRCREERLPKGGDGSPQVVDADTPESGGLQSGAVCLPDFTLVRGAPRFVNGNCRRRDSRSFRRIDPHPIVLIGS